jgi:hypothetical protein
MVIKLTITFLLYIDYGGESGNIILTVLSNRIEGRNK